MHASRTSASRASRAALKSLRETRPAPFWLDAADAPAPRPALTGAVSCDLAVVGAGFTGLWTALLAKEQDPGLDVVVLEAGAAGGQASGRNGGICMASLTHGFAQGAELFPEENRRLVELGDENLDAIERTVRELSIDCGWERTGEMEIATAPWQVDGLREQYEQGRGRRHRPARGWTGRSSARRSTRPRTSPATGTTTRRSSTPRASPGAWRARVKSVACASSRARPSPLSGACPGGVGLVAPWGVVRAHRVVLATNAFRPLLRRLRLHVVPVYDYALMTEPLTPVAARVHRLAAPAGAGGRRLHVPLLPAHRGPAHPLGRLGRDVLPRPAHPQGVRGPARPVRQAGRSLLHDLPPARGAGLHPPLGRRDRHLLALLPVLGHGAGRARRPTRSATPAWAWPPHASAPAWRWTWRSAGARSSRRWTSCAPARCRSRPSRCCSR